MSWQLLERIGGRRGAAQLTQQEEKQRSDEQEQQPLPVGLCNDVCIEAPHVHEEESTMWVNSGGVGNSGVPGEAAFVSASYQRATCQAMHPPTSL